MKKKIILKTYKHPITLKQVVCMDNTSANKLYRNLILYNTFTKKFININISLLKQCLLREHLIVSKNSLFWIDQALKSMGH